MQPNSKISKINIFFLLFFCSSLVLAEPGGEESKLNLKGIVENEKGEALKGATISLERNGQTLETYTTDENGSFNITLEKFYPGVSETYLYVRRNGYKTTRLKVFPQCGTHPFKVQLDRKTREPHISHPLTKSTYFTI